MVFGAMALAAATAAPNPASSHWERMGELERGGTLAVAGVMLALLTFLVARQLLRRKAPPRDPVKLHRWFRGYHYDWATGTVANVSHVKREEKRSGEDASPVYVTTVFEGLTLVFAGGRHDVRVSFPNEGRDPVAFPVFSGCEGHRMTAVWRRRSKDDEHGRYVVFRDWTTGANIDHPAASPHIHQSDAPIFSFLPVLVLGWIVGMSTDWPSFLDGVVRYVLLAVAFGVAWFAIQFVVGTIDRGRSDEQLAQALLVIGAEDASPQDPRAVP